jgi:hypothetical protein
MRLLRSKPRTFRILTSESDPRSATALDARLHINSVQIDTDTGRLVVLEAVEQDRVHVTELGGSFTLGMPIPRADWLSHQYRTPTPRELDAYRKGLSPISNDHH